MDTQRPASTSLFDVYLRLRPHGHTAERFLDVENPGEGHNTHITIRPPTSDHRKRAVEKFGFTRVFEENATQLDVFNETSLLPLLEGVLAPAGRAGRDGLLATLGVTGSGKSHTILGSKSQRGLTQMSLDVLFKSINGSIVNPSSAIHGLAAGDVSESQLASATSFLESQYCDTESRMNSRAQTPMLVSNIQSSSPSNFLQPGLGRSLVLLPTLAPLHLENHESIHKTIRPVTGFARITKSVADWSRSPKKESNANHVYTTTATRRNMPQASTMPQNPSTDEVVVACDKGAEYAIVVSMYEVYNDRIFDLLTGTATNSKVPSKDMKRRPLLFKSTEYSPERKVVAGLQKVVCGNLQEALMVLETGLLERKVAGTGSNATSSRSHGFFCVEVKKRDNAMNGSWTGNMLTIVDLAGSERARSAKTAGTTLAEAGKINESLMYLGQCMQMQSDNSNMHYDSVTGITVTSAKPALVPFRQCKLTELLFSNSFHNNHHQHGQNIGRWNQPQQKAMMIVTADASGDFNATSQILRYSALAREVTVPRIPSVTSTILSGSTCNNTANNTSTISSRPGTASEAQSNTSNRSLSPFTSDEQASTNAELVLLRMQLAEETTRRRAAETSWVRAENRLQESEAEIRQECWDAFETRLTSERHRWQEAWGDATEANERHLDEKVDILTRSVGAIEILSDAAPSHEALESRCEELERENAYLKQQVEVIKRERDVGRTPSRKVKLFKSAPRWGLDDQENVDENYS